MSSIRRFEEIKAWQKARVLVREVYAASKSAPFSQDFALRNHMCRASVSTMTNIAGRFARKSTRDFAHFLDMARGSALEVQSLSYATLDIDHIDEPTFTRLYALVEEATSLIAGFSSYLRSLPVTPNFELRTRNSS